MGIRHKILARVDDGDFRDCAATGYRWKLYGDGHLSAEYMTCWQGSHAGQRWITVPGYVDIGDIVEDDPDQDAEAMLTMATHHIIPDVDPDWRQTRRGYVIR